MTSGKLTGKVRAGFVSSLAYRVMPDLLTSLKKVAPGIGVELSEMPDPEQIRLIRDIRSRTKPHFCPS